MLKIYFISLILLKGFLGVCVYLLWLGAPSPIPPPVVLRPAAPAQTPTSPLERIELWNGYQPSAATVESLPADIQRLVAPDDSEAAFARCKYSYQDGTLTISTQYTFLLPKKLGENTVVAETPVSTTFAVKRASMFQGHTRIVPTLIRWAEYRHSGTPPGEAVVVMTKPNEAGIEYICITFPTK